MLQAINAGTKRTRTASHLQKDIEEQDGENELARLERQEKELARKKKKLLKQREKQANDSNNAPESQDDEDKGWGRMTGGGFTSNVTLQGVVQTLGGTKATKHRRLIREDDIQSDPMYVLLSSWQSTFSLEYPGNFLLETHSVTLVSMELVESSLHLHPVLDDLCDNDDLRDDTQPPQSSSPSVDNADRWPAMPLLPPELTHLPRQGKLPPAPFCEGKVPGKKKAKASDYDEGVEKLLLDAMHDYACLILTKNTFPEDDTQIKWARTAWKNACNKVDSHYQLSHCMLKLITERGSWACGLLKDAAREHFQEYFKFKKGSGEETKTYNQELRTSLLNEDAFIHKDPDAGTGYAESPIITDIIETALFEDSSDYSVRFSTYFKPIPFNLLALVIAVLEFLIDEYLTGEKVKGSFSETKNKICFEKHLKRVEEWGEFSEQVTTNIRMKLYKRLMKRAGASNHQVGHTVLGMTTGMCAKVQQELTKRTGETDSEPE